MSIECPHCGYAIEKKPSSKNGVAIIMIQINYILRCPHCNKIFNDYSSFGTEFEIPNENVLQAKIS